MRQNVSQKIRQDIISCQSCFLWQILFWQTHKISCFKCVSLQRRLKRQQKWKWSTKRVKASLKTLRSSKTCVILCACALAQHVVEQQLEKETRTLSVQVIQMRNRLKKHDETMENRDQVCNEHVNFEKWTIIDQVRAKMASEAQKHLQLVSQEEQQMIDLINKHERLMSELEHTKVCFLFSFLRNTKTETIWSENVLWFSGSFFCVLSCVFVWKIKLIFLWLCLLCKKFGRLKLGLSQMWETLQRLKFWRVLTDDIKNCVKIEKTLFHTSFFVYFLFIFDSHCQTSSHLVAIQFLMTKARLFFLANVEHFFGRNENHTDICPKKKFFQKKVVFMLCLFVENMLNERLESWAQHEQDLKQLEQHRQEASKILRRIYDELRTAVQDHWFVIQSWIWILSVKKFHFVFTKSHTHPLRLVRYVPEFCPCPIVAIWTICEIKRNSFVVCFCF